MRDWASRQQVGESATLEVDPPSPCQASYDRSPGRHLDASLMVDADPELPNSAAPGSLTHGNCGGW